MGNGDLLNHTVAASDADQERGGPSRLKNKRQAKIVEMVDGYDSTVTLATALRNVLLVWALPGLASVILGGMGFGNSSRLMADQHVRWLGAIRAGTVLLWVVTAITAAFWAVRTWGNIRRVGKAARIGVFKIFMRHFWFFVSSIFFGVAAIVNGSNARLFIMLSLLMGLIASAFVPSVILAMVRLFWRSGSPVNGGLVDELPPYGTVWFATFYAYFSTEGLYSVPELRDYEHLITIFSGLCCMTAALTGARLVSAISRRQDERLEMIIAQVEIDDSREGNVTSHQIESAWANSESLVRFDIH
ncbi:MAG: hypothetical protein O3C27_07710 [Actinomycetota bacterium]|nr:hypothetical protein [Actinomycetota bacterium]